MTRSGSTADCSNAKNVPVGAVIAKRAVIEAVFDKMDRAVVHSSTFGQNVLAMTAGLATLHAIDTESIVERAATTGSALLADLQSVAERHEVVHEVRGRGLMIGIELVQDRATKEPLSHEKIGELMGYVLSHGVMMVPCGRYGNVMRVMPSLTIPRSLLFKALDIFGRGLSTL